MNVRSHEKSSPFGAISHIDSATEWMCDVINSRYMNIDVWISFSHMASHRTASYTAWVDRV